MEEQFTNHSEEVVQDTQIDTSVDTQQEEVETPATTQEEYDVIKYNKEEVKIPVSERQNYLQKGYNYDKIKEQVDQLTPYQQHLEKVAQLSGYQTTDDFIRALEEAEQTQRVQQESSKLGIDPEAYKQHFQPVNEKVSTLESELRSLREKEAIRQVEQEVDSLKDKYSDFAQYEDKVFELAQTRGFNLEEAYKLATYEDRINNVARQTEQEVLAKVTGRDSKQVLAGNDQPSNTKFDPSSMSFAEIEALSKRARSGERITF